MAAFPEPVTWGFDPSVNQPAIAEWPTARHETITTIGRAAPRLANLLDQWSDLIHRWYVPGLEAVYVERIRGEYPKDALVMAAGIIEAVTEKVLRELGSTAEVIEISTMEWKAHAVGHGHAEKATVMHWAHENGYDGDNQDEADAFAIACAGHRLLHAPQQDALALS